MVEIVAGHGFDDGLESHGAALGMCDRLGGGAGQSFRDELQIPGAQGGESCQSVFGGNALIGSGPLVLVKGLKDVVVFCEGLAETEGEGDLAVGEVAYDFRGRPLAGCGRFGWICQRRSSGACWRSRVR